MAYSPFARLGTLLLQDNGLDARNIRGGVITAQELIIAGGTRGVIRSQNFVPSPLEGWAIFGDGSAFFGSDVTFGGDIISSNWDGADPLSLSVIDSTATAGFGLDSSLGTGQFAGNLFVGRADHGYMHFVTSGANALELNLVDSGDDVAAQLLMNGTAAAGTLTITGPTVILGALVGNLSLSAAAISADAAFTISTTPGAANEQLIFTDTDYSIFQDNTGAGADGSRLWFDAPDGGQVVFGPRAGGAYLDRFDVLSDALRFEWEDSGGDIGIHTWPKGIVYDWAFDTTAGEATSGAYPSDITGLTCTVSVPQDISVTIMVMAHIRYDHSADAGEIVFFQVEIGGTAPVQAAAVEMDLTTSAAGTGNTGAGGTGNTGSNGGQIITLSGNSGAASSGTAHTHTVGSYNPSDTSDHTHTGPSHTHSGPSHTHALSSQFKTIPYVGMRSFTPTGTTVDIQAIGGGTSGAVTYDDGILIAWVLVN